MAVKYIECPEIYGQPSLFMGGGISGCPDWQAEMVKILESMESDLVLINPRRAHFDVKDEKRTDEQIAWEYLMLRRADGIMFWFAKETIQPIVLFELGSHLMTAGKPIFIGMDPDYQRRIDVITQTRQIRPGLDKEIVFSLQALAGQIIAWESKFKQSGLWKPPT